MAKLIPPCCANTTNTEFSGFRPAHAGGVRQISEFLARNPHLGVQSKDDTKYKAFFNELGVLSHLHYSNEHNLSAMLCTHHPTHWVIGRLWSGYPLRHQNGYAVDCLPKKFVSEFDARNYKRDLMELYGGHSQMDYDVRTPPDWRRTN